MKSNSNKLRTVSTATNSKAQLPKILIKSHEADQLINRKLFADNKSTVSTSKNKITRRERIKTEVNS
jgi:hypothetical protein